MVDELPTREKSFDSFYKILANRTTHTAIRDFDDFFDRSFDQGSINSCRSEFVFHDGDFSSFCFADYVIEEGGLSASEKACNNSDRNHKIYYIQKCNERVTKELTRI